MPKITPEELAQWVRENYPPPATSEVVWFYCKAFEHIYDNNRDLYEDRLEELARIVETPLDPGSDQELALFCLSSAAHALVKVAEEVLRRRSLSVEALWEAADLLDKDSVPQATKALRKALTDVQDDLLVMGVELKMQANFRGSFETTSAAAARLVERLNNCLYYTELFERGAYAELAVAIAYLTDAFHVSYGGPTSFALSLSSLARKP